MKPLIRMTAALLLVLGGLLLAPSRASVQDAPKALVVLEEDEPQTTYPLLSRTMSEQRLAELLFDRFFFLTPGGDLDSRIFAAEWRTRPPNLTVAVRKDLKFADGTVASFSDIAFTMNEVYRRASLGHPAAPWYARVFGDAQQITPEAGSIRYLVSMPDEGSERYLMTTALLSRDALMAEGGAPDLEATERQPVGTGPFWAAGPIGNFDDITLQANPHRLGAVDGDKAALRVQALRLLYDQDAARQKELMDGNRADLWVSPPPAVLPAFKAQRDRFGVRTYDLNQWWYVAVDTNHPHLADPAVRAALDLCVPRAQLLEKFGGESASPTSGPFLPGSAWESGDAAPTSEDREAAAALLTEAGYTKTGSRWSKDGSEIELRLGVEGDVLDDYNDVVYGMVDAWEDAGFRVRVRGIRESDWRAVVEAGKARGEHDLILGRWNLDREEAALELFRKPSGDGPTVNLFGWGDDRVEQIIKDFYGETSGPEREALMQKLHRMLHDERPYLFLWSLRVQSIYRRDRVTGFGASPFYYFTRIDKIAWRQAEE